MRGGTGLSLTEPLGHFRSHPAGALPGRPICAEARSGIGSGLALDRVVLGALS